MNIPAADNLQLSEEGDGIRIPLKHNLNDKGCLFAGSIYAGAILAAYREAKNRFSERGLTGELVAKTASVNYLKRMVSDGLASASACGEPVCKPNGNSMLTVTVSVFDEARVCCAELLAEFVLLKERTTAGDAGRSRMCTPAEDAR